MKCGFCQILTPLILFAAILLVVARAQPNSGNSTVMARAVMHQPSVTSQPAGQQQTDELQDDEHQSDAQQDDEASGDQQPAASAGRDRTLNPNPDLYSDAELLPDWALIPNRVEADGRTEFVVVHSNALLQQREAREELEERMLDTVRRKVDEMFSPGAAAAIGIDLGYLRQNLLVPGNEFCQVLYWDASTVMDAGDIATVSDTDRAEPRTAYRCFARLKLDSDFQQWATVTWHERQVRSRQMQIGLIFLSGVLMLVLAFGYFKANEKTRGIYSGRLQSMALIGLLAIIAAAVLLSKMFPWL